MTNNVHTLQYSVKFSVGLDLVFNISTPSHNVNSITSNFSIKLFLLYYLIIFHIILYQIISVAHWAHNFSIKFGVMDWRRTTTF